MHTPRLAWFGVVVFGLGALAFAWGLHRTLSVGPAPALAFENAEAIAVHHLSEFAGLSAMAGGFIVALFGLAVRAVVSPRARGELDSMTAHTVEAAAAAARRGLTAPTDRLAQLDQLRSRGQLIAIEYDEKRNEILRSI